MSRHLIFVYGTLKTGTKRDAERHFKDFAYFSGQPNHYVMNDKTLGNANLVGKAETVDEFPLVITSKYNIPFLLHKKGTGNVIVNRSSLYLNTMYNTLCLDLNCKLTSEYSINFILDLI